MCIKELKRCFASNHYVRYQTILLDVMLLLEIHVLLHTFCNTLQTDTYEKIDIKCTRRTINLIQISEKCLPYFLNSMLESEFDMN